MSLLALEGVRKSFGKNVVLQDIDLTVERGQCVVLIGASGSGKSTLLRCVNLLEAGNGGPVGAAASVELQQAGTLLVAGTPLARGPAPGWLPPSSGNGLLVIPESGNSPDAG